jgi:integrase
MLAGLRRGELMALDWENVDLKGKVLRVERSYEPTAGEYGSPKSRQGVRAIPVADALLPYLREHQLRTGRREGLVFGMNELAPFRPTDL